MGINITQVNYPCEDEPPKKWGIGKNLKYMALVLLVNIGIGALVLILIDSMITSNLIIAFLGGGVAGNSDQIIFYHMK